MKGRGRADFVELGSQGGHRCDGLVAAAGMLRRLELGVVRKKTDWQ